MVSSVIGLLSHDLAVDLGTSHVRIHRKHAGLVADEPTVVAVRTSAHGRRDIVAVGNEALPMLGRTPEDTVTIQPIRAGRVIDFEVAEALLLHLVRRIHGRNGWMRPKMVVAMPHRASPMEVRAVRDSCESAGAREVVQVARPIAAAIGAGLPIGDPSGMLIVDVGGGAAEVSVLSLKGVVSSEVVPNGGGDGMDDAILQWLRSEKALLVGRPSAERLKVELGTAAEVDPTRKATVAGRCLRRGVPRAETVDQREIAHALAPCVDAIARAIRRAIEQAPPELGADIVDQGAVIVGGGARLRGLEQALRDRTGLAIVGADHPEHAVLRGVGRVLDHKAFV
jgi:rod shape-determining protein MreB